MVLREILHAHIPSLTRESTVKDAIDKMDIYQFPALVIIDKARKPIGIITEGDICRQLNSSKDLKRLAEKKAIEIGINDLMTDSPDTEISKALDTMLQNSLTLLPIVEREILIGIVLRVDLMQAMNT